jgi:hypothetical protein
MPISLAKGTQGSWFATIQRGPHRGRVFPCVHYRFCEGIWPQYMDPVAGHPLDDDYVNAIQHGRIVLLTKSKPDGKRSNYVGLFEVIDVHWSNELSFRFSKELAR